MSLDLCYMSAFSPSYYTSMSQTSYFILLPCPFCNKPMLQLLFAAAVLLLLVLLLLVLLLLAAGAGATGAAGVRVKIAQRMIQTK